MKTFFFVSELKVKRFFEMSIFLTGTEIGYRKNALTFFGSCFIHLALGITFGKHIDQYSENIAKRLGLTRLGSTVLQMFLFIGVLYLIEKHISFYFADELQRTTPGIIFSFAFFVAQKRLTYNLEYLL
jgi:hypothetical protein